MNALRDKYLPHYSYDDYVQWEGRWELIDGIPYAMAPAPTWYHQDINSNIVTELKNKLVHCKDCHSTIYVDWKINENTVLQPDALVVCQPLDEKIPYITVIPEIIFEILSPSTASKDRLLKHEIYEQQGVKYYILVNPKDKTAEIFLLENGKYKSVTKLTTEPFTFNTSKCSFDFEFAKIW